MLNFILWLIVGAVIGWAASICWTVASTSASYAGIRALPFLQ